MVPEHAPDLCTRAYKFDGRSASPPVLSAVANSPLRAETESQHPCIDARHAALANQNESMRKHGVIAPIHASAMLKMQPCFLACQMQSFVRT
jgi:hypothetical protein